MMGAFIQQKTAAKKSNFNFASGVVILIFSMLALYSSLQMMNEHEQVFSFYKNQNHNLFEFEEIFIELESDFDRHHPSGQRMQDMRRHYEMLQEKHAAIMRELNDAKNVYVSQNYRQALIDIKELFPFLFLIFESDKAGRYDDVALRLRSFHEKIETLWLALFSDEQSGYLTKRMKNRQQWFYWSVLALGLTGFILIILNEDKVRQLQNLNVERESALELLQNRLAAMEATFEGICIIRPDDKISYINPAMMRLFGFMPERLESSVGQPWQTLFPQADQERLGEEVKSSLRASGIWTGEAKIPLESGPVIDAAWTMSLLPDGGMIGTAMDITEQKKAEKEKADLQQQFFQAQKMEAIGRLTGGIAHDFNNILAAINGYAEFLVEDLLDGTQEKTFAKNILQAGKQGRGLVDQLMAFSRRKDNIIEAMDLLAPVQETLAILGSSMPSGIEIQKSFTLQAAPIEGNPTQISQVLMNLCVNARDAMDADKGVLKVACGPVNIRDYLQLGVKYDAGQATDTKTEAIIAIDEMTPGHARLVLNTLKVGYDYVALSVEDTGTGMSRAIMEHIFEPFFTTKPVHKGTGLGLATVHGVVLSHNAVLVVDSKLGHGTRFEILFPLVKHTAKQAAEEEGRMFPEDGQANILLVEDQEDVRLMTQTMLERMGYLVADTMNGLEALSVLREYQGAFDLVLTDYNMPKMSGMELVEQAWLEFPDLPFLIMTGQNETDLETMAKSFPSVRGIFRKPVSKEQLAAQIKAILSHKSYGQTQKGAA